MVSRLFVGVRIGEPGLALVDAFAVEQGVKRSPMLRLLLALGMQEWQRADPGQRRALAHLHGLTDKSED